MQDVKRRRKKVQKRRAKEVYLMQRRGVVGSVLVDD
jgi:hypothetical protein